MNKYLKAVTLPLSTLLLPFPINADNVINIKSGFAFDQGFGITALINDQFSLMLGNKGLAGDYLVKKGKFNPQFPFTWYLAGGAYAQWNDGFGARLPLGLNLNFAPNWHGYAQIAPDFDFNDAKFGAQFALGLRYRF